MSMRSGWRNITVGEFAHFTYGKSLPARKRNPAGKVAVFGSNGIVGYHDDALTSNPTIIIGRKGTVGAVHYSPLPCWPIDTTFFVTGHDEELMQFKYYALRNLGLEEMNSDSAVPGLNRNAAHARELFIPDESEQRRIARVLGALDDKIELNRRMNATLEGMARALFRSWFVDFEPVRAKMEGRWRRGETLPGMPAELYDLFPERLAPSQLGDVPEGWDVKTLGDSFSLTMGQSPPGNTYNDNGEGLSFFQGSTDFGFRYPTKRRYCSEPKRIANFDDTLVSVRAPVGAMNMAWERCCIGRGLAALRHRSGSTSYTYYAIMAMQGELQLYEHTGTVFGSISKRHFENIKSIDPLPRVVELFDSFASEWDAKIRLNNGEAQSLAALRDALLPGLVSGDMQLGHNDEIEAQL